MEQRNIKIGTHEEQYGNWMSNPVFYMLGGGIKDAGYEEVRLVDTTEEIFGSKSRAKMLALGASTALVGRK